MLDYTKEIAKCHLYTRFRHYRMATKYFLFRRTKISVNLFTLKFRHMMLFSGYEKEKHATCFVVHLRGLIQSNLYKICLKFYYPNETKLQKWKMTQGSI